MKTKKQLGNNQAAFFTGVRMDSILTLFGKEIPLYGILYYCGVFLSVLVATRLAKGKIPTFDIVCSAIYITIGGVVGAKLLFILVSWKDILAYQLPLSAILKGGFVFYGGLIGGTIGLLIYCRQFSLSFFSFADVYAAVLPLGHALGRVGCHFSGCCYGRPYDGPFSVTYTKVLGTTPLNTALFPIQLTEALFLFSLFLLLVTIPSRRKAMQNSGTISALYCLLYGILRFTIECFRGDKERGFMLFFSTSQWISLFLFLFGLFLLMHFRKKHASLSEKTRSFL